MGITAICLRIPTPENQGLGLKILPAANGPAGLPEQRLVLWVDVEALESCRKYPYLPLHLVLVVTPHGKQEDLAYRFGGRRAGGKGDAAVDKALVLWFSQFRKCSLGDDACD